jgi:hypothetical protein
VRFTERYQPLQRLAEGSVETVAALDTASNEKVVIHIFGYRQEEGAPGSTEQILRLFGGMGAEPVSPVVAAGTFDSKALAYIVSKWPGDEVLAAWLRSYQGRFQGSAEAQSPAGATIVESATKVFSAQRDQETRIEATPPEKSKEFATTSLFAVGLRAEMSGAEQAIANTVESSKVEPSGFFQLDRKNSATGSFNDSHGEPGEFTQQFFPSAPERDGGEKSPNHLLGPTFDKAKVEPKVDMPEGREKTQNDFFGGFGAEEHAPFRPKVGTPLMQTIEEGQFTELFFKRIEPDTPSAPPEVERRGEPPGAGIDGFTSYLRGPFSGQQSATPANLPVDWTPKEKPPSDFTKVFGTDEKSRSIGSAPDPIVEPQKSTEILRDPYSGSPRSNTRIQPQDRSYDSSPGSLREIPQPPAVSPAPAEQISSQAFGVGGLSIRPDESPGATRVFGRDSEPLVDHSVSSRGPSEWTTFQRSAAKPRADVEDSAKPDDSPQNPWAKQALEGAIQYAPPAPSLPTPAAPVFTPPQAAPAVAPVFSPPQVPLPMQAPPVPVVPQVPATPQVPILPSSPSPTPAPKGSASYWPLIIVINVVFVLAVLLILYFALKH